MKRVPLFEEFNDPTHWYVGLADCHGIESFLEEPDMSDADDLERMTDLGFDGYAEEANKIRKGWSQQVAMLKLRANANGQRFPVVYRAQVKKSDADVIEDLMDKGEYANALNYLKSTALDVQAAKVGGINPEKAWNKIPNPELDPYY